jgi:hypothetical protein
VGVLGDSGYPYCEAFPDEKLPSWIAAQRHNLEYLGGLPKIIVPDNPRTAVSKANYYDPVLNESYREMAEYYGVAVLPCRVRKPKDKALAENSVGWLETWLLEDLREHVFDSFAELNMAIRGRLKELSRRPYQKRAGSRESVFLEIDKPCLRPLPMKAFELSDFRKRHVPDNYHVEYDGFYYSVPFRYYRQEVTVKAGYSLIQIYDKERHLITVHELNRSGKRYVTKEEHMPENHKFMLAQKGRDGNSYRGWAKTVGENTYFVIDSLLLQAVFEETAYRSCMAILQESKSCGVKRLEAACKKARELGSITYTTIKNILRNRQEEAPPPEYPVKACVHENIRGPLAFR